MHLYCTGTTTIPNVFFLSHYAVVLTHQKAGECKAVSGYDSGLAVANVLLILSDLFRGISNKPQLCQNICHDIIAGMTPCTLLQVPNLWHIIIHM